MVGTFSQAERNLSSWDAVKANPNFERFFLVPNPLPDAAKVLIRESRVVREVGPGAQPALLCLYH